ncbi:MAG TPA: HEAT repeat domain-containing protein, partial [Dietzia timorensis]|nr:HEAT repeat domain-containing protein [Dietzia timorensis]
RGTAEVKRSLAMAFVELGYAAEDVLEDAARAEDADTAAHARATLHLLRNPEAGFGYALEEANRATALGFRQMETG